MNTQDKSLLRKSLCTQRTKLAPNIRETAAYAAAAIFSASSLFQRSHHIACYFAMNNEFDAFPLIQEIWRAGKNCYLPVLDKQHEGLLHFALYESDSELKLNRYNILEPDAPPDKFFPTQQLDIVLTPLVGFDLHGQRLGMGGGYYDRTFAYRLQEKNLQQHLLGVAYAFQQVETLPREDWDVALDGVLTEQQLILF